MTRELGVGIIGCGNISTTYFSLAPLFKGLKVLACADINAQAAEARAKEYGVKAQTIDALLVNDEIDVVVNLTIPDAHFRVSKAILEAGKHVYSEKPLVLSLEEGEELRRIAKQKNLAVGCAPDTFLGGAHQLARKFIDDGGIGRVTSGACYVMSPGMEMWHPNPDFFFLPGGGPILDLGPYYIANLINLIGPVKRVGGMTSMASPTRTITSEPRNGEIIPVKTPTTIQALLEFVNGATVTLTASWDVWSHRHANMELYGTDGSLYVPDPNFFGGTVEASGRDKDIKPLEAWEHPFGKINQENPNGARANYRTAGLADMVMALIEGRDARCSLDRTLHGVDVMTSILKSGEEGRFIDLTTTCTQPAALGIEEAQALLK
ncbi:Gfo/Idh/MocA family protein [Rhizobium leguminosarum]|uniref:Gfo/Idh/MocA family oxidoreductase n=1 Tax=Rhizobium leguminosarum TaxID=384 RepID=A0A2Z4YCA8_RHILE|nr:Gfo/Idh/MocA family oxidoreductase [Rhizobium leguminosarum]MDH6658169.1 putative dehydrogenase [Rhizobium sophorae]ASS57058.1 gfo/Idh/MocA family oxidoreductase [Rhizobium leguminosarum bv. viciae]AVC50191.1 oxidoreductase, NAD-binding Rossmann fold family protein [Rhizobium leguminosarum bv. viciae]AXA38569.1 Oxidoreductase family, NAD-binding Rossmann fold protein [Rhizobium leguminosarum]MBB4329390.1 putative dehydrogenase [Rhizobium leguminosarum]